MSETLARFHEVLVQEIRKNRPEYLDAPFTVAEIYQNLVPYRTHRDALGVEMNGDYEHALLRLLGGEGDYLEIESEVARRQIRDELGQPNPNTGLFRDFAAADVRLKGPHPEAAAVESQQAPTADEVSNTGPQDADAGTRDLSDLLDEAERAMETATEGPDEEADGEDFGGDDVAEPTLVDDEGPRRLFVMAGGDEDEEHDDVSPEFEPEDPTVHAFGGQEDPEEHTEESPTPTAGGKAESEESGVDDPSCHWCRAELPPRNVLNFCPFCGSNLDVKPCGECGEELDPGWMFCPACGTEAR